MRATPFSVEDVLLLAKRYPSARGLRRLRTALPLVDPGAASPKESWLRLLLINAGLPAPETQIPVVDHYRTLAVLDMGWEQFMVAVEYDGDQHRTSRRQCALRRFASGARGAPSSRLPRHLDRQPSGRPR